MSLVIWLWRGAYLVGGVASLGVGLLYFMQEKLLYIPSAPGISKHYERFPDQVELSHEDVELQTSDGLSLHAWLLWHPRWNKAVLKEQPLVLFFQANAGNISHRLPFLSLLIRKLHCTVLALSYRGYGPNDGSPVERGLKIDAVAAIEYVLNREDLNSEQLVLMGRSLGGAVAMSMAVQYEHKVKALIVENTFTSVEDMVPQVLPFLGHIIGRGRWCNFLVRNKWNNREEIKRLRIPILLLSSTEDEIVPTWQMRELKDAAGSQECSLVELHGAHHMDACDVCPTIYWRELQKFFEQHVGNLKM